MHAVPHETVFMQIYQSVESVYKNINPIDSYVHGGEIEDLYLPALIHRHDLHAKWNPGNAGQA